MASRLGLRSLLGPPCRERDIAYALILSRAVRPKPKLSTARWWAAGDTTLGIDLAVADASTDEIYAAMDWLTSRQREIEKKLAARHLREGGTAMFDLSSSWMEGSCCELAAFGHSRDGKRGRKQIEYGLLTCPEGRPVAVEVFPGNTSDPESFKTAITRVRRDFGIERLIMVGDRGMITGTRISDLRKLDGMDWITALKAPAIAKLAHDAGPLQMSLFDTHNFAEITHPDYPGERLICCHNPVLAANRARTREDLLTATENDLAKIKASVAAGRLKDPDKIGIRIGKVIGKHKVGKHFITEVTGASFTWRRDQEKIAAEAAFDGIYVIRTSVDAGTLDAADVVSAYKDLKHVDCPHLPRPVLRAFPPVRPIESLPAHGGQKPVPVPRNPLRAPVPSMRKDHFHEVQYAPYSWIALSARSFWAGCDQRRWFLVSAGGDKDRDHHDVNGFSCLPHRPRGSHDPSGPVIVG